MQPNLSRQIVVPGSSDRLEGESAMDHFRTVLSDYSCKLWIEDHVPIAPPFSEKETKRVPGG